ncbi:LysR family transcriptional regulator [Vineibacter terrae]|uniref:LysR family transcriptional regulator n=1 Tax=Vineibacter terrae TaxID=2586908 RepID=UPI002E2F91FC|nr:LysR family transcriptional regulator [Vineibacter terrae]HEX2888929.1 LysR family transcriptional regulator [Vineibacter terrae]
MRSINLDQLRTFTEVVACGSFSAAARRLNLTQPAVSLQVRELERRLRISLIERMGRTARATAPGRELIEHARRIFRECESATSAMDRFRDGRVGRVHIATTLTALTYQLPPVLTRLRQDHPGIELQVTNMSTCDSVEAIIDNSVDLALITLPVDETHLRVTPLRPEMLVAILPEATPDIPDLVTPDYVASQPLVLEHTRGAIHGLIMQWLSGQLPLAREPMRLGTVEALKNVVALGPCMSIVPDVAVADTLPGIVVRPLSPALPCTLGLAEHHNRPREPALDVVRQALLDLGTITSVDMTPCSQGRGHLLNGARGARGPVPAMARVP